MPIVKPSKKREPLWREWDKKAQKEGVRAPIHSVSGNQYTGEWSDNMKCGKGNQVWQKTGSLYDGDWQAGKRHGFGTLSVKKGDIFMKKYAGTWKNDMKHGYGTYFYTEKEYYEGEWYANMRSGWGRIYYADGSIYEGEWYNDKQNGRGLLKLANSNRYEGLWKDGLKNGEGKFFYLDKGQVYTGTWMDGTAKCGYMEDFGRDGAPNPPIYPIPTCTVENADEVLLQTKQSISS